MCTLTICPHLHSPLACMAPLQEPQQMHGHSMTPCLQYRVHIMWLLGCSQRCCSCLDMAAMWLTFICRSLDTDGHKQQHKQAACTAPSRAPSCTLAQGEKHRGGWVHLPCNVFAHAESCRFISISGDAPPAMRKRLFTRQRMTHRASWRERSASSSTCGMQNAKNADVQ